MCKAYLLLLQPRLMQGAMAVTYDKSGPVGVILCR